jgi:uncharacterized membrane protein
MYNELKQENANLRFENAKLKFETLFNERPSTIRSFAFHGGLRIFYLVIGIIGSVAALIYFGIMLVACYVNDQVSKDLQDSYHVNDPVASAVADAVIPTHLFLSIVLLILSICFLIMARLCRKIVRRNMYIMDLENIWIDIKQG